MLLSFFYTNKVVEYFKNNDPIMIEIKKYDYDFSNTKVEPIINYSDIIPGVSGQKIDINKSDSNMKKAGKFDKNLLVFKKTTSDKNLIGNYDNFIVSLNSTQNNVSILIELKSIKYINEIISILENKNTFITFFVSKDIIDNNKGIIKQIIDYGHEVELLSSNYSVYEINKYNSILKLLSNNRLTYCLNIDRNRELLKSCKTSKLYSIVPMVKKSKGLYLYMQNNLHNGLIILLDDNKQIINELSSTINYIKQKGKNIVLLKSIIEQ